MNKYEQGVFDALTHPNLLNYAAVMYWNKGINVIYDDNKLIPMAVRYNIYDLGLTFNLSVEFKGLQLVDDFKHPMLDSCLECGNSGLYGPALFWNNLHALYINKLNLLVDIGPNAGRLKHLLPEGLYDYGDRRMFSANVIDFYFDIPSGG